MIARAELETVLDQLAEVYRPEGVLIWLRAPHRAFGGRAALDLLDSGEGDEVLAELDRLTSGAFA